MNRSNNKFIAETFIECDKHVDKIKIAKKNLLAFMPSMKRNIVLLMMLK